MQILKLRPATELVGGIQTPCYGIFCGDHLVRTVSAFGYDDALAMVLRANVVIEDQLTAMMRRGVQIAKSQRAKKLTAANKARKLGD